MRTRALAAGVAMLALAACSDVNPVAQRTPDHPRASFSDGYFTVDAGTFERQGTATYWATYSGGYVDVEENRVGGWAWLATIEAVWGNHEDFSTLGLPVRVTAHAYSGCTFLRWRMDHGATISTSNPLNLSSSFPSSEQVTGEFQCVA